MRSLLERLDTALAQNAALVEQVAKLNERVAELLPVAKRKARKAERASMQARLVLLRAL